MSHIKLMLSTCLSVNLLSLIGHISRLVSDTSPLSFVFNHLSHHFHLFELFDHVSNTLRARVDVLLTSYIQ